MDKDELFDKLYSSKEIYWIRCYLPIFINSGHKKEIQEIIEEYGGNPANVVYNN